MTAQLDDIFALNDKNFAIVGVNGGELFNPQSIGVHPVAVMSICWRGYVCKYKIHSQHLILDKLHMTLGEYEGAGRGRKFIQHKGPIVNGVHPTFSEDKSSAFNNLYEELSLEIKFTGGMLIADHFIEELYVHMGFHPAWKYQTVIELIFDDGKVQDIRDVSAQLEQIRNKMIEAPLKPDILKSSKQEVESWIKETFKLDYDLGE